MYLNHVTKKSGGHSWRLEFIGFIKFFFSRKEKKGRGKNGKVEDRGGGWKIHERVSKKKEIRCAAVLWRLIIAVIKMRGSCTRPWRKLKRSRRDGSQKWVEKRKTRGGRGVSGRGCENTAAVLTSKVFSKHRDFFNKPSSFFFFPFTSIASTMNIHTNPREHAWTCIPSSRTRVWKVFFGRGIRVFPFLSLVRFFLYTPRNFRPDKIGEFERESRILASQFSDSSIIVGNLEHVTYSFAIIFAFVRIDDVY